LSDNDHYHYASDLHDGAEKHHRHYDLEREDETAQQDIRRLREDVRELRSLLDGALDRIGELEAERHTDVQPEIEPEPEEYDPGPECDDEGGASEYRHITTLEEPW
jgi:hypothetical protein